MEQSPEINSYVYGQLIYDRGAKNIQWGKDSFYNKWCWKSGQPHGKVEMTSPSYTIKLVEENIGGELLDIRLSSDFLDMKPKAKATKAKINKWDYSK